MYETRRRGQEVRRGKGEMCMHMLIATDLAQAFREMNTFAKVAINSTSTQLFYRAI